MNVVLELFMVFGFAAPVVHGATVTWSGAAGTNWADGANWGGVSPGAGDDVVIDGGANQPSLNLSGGAVTIASLSVGPTTASLLTLLNGDTTGRCLSVSGNVAIGPQGTLTHASNTTAAVHHLDVNVGGNLTVASGGRISADGRGFMSGQGPGSPGTDSRSGGSHGGMGSTGSGATYPKIVRRTYGHYMNPTNLGSGGGIWGGGKSGSGGGVIRLTVAGQTSLEGIVSADAATTTESGGTGGSIYLSTGTLSGSGTISADGAAQGLTGYGGGGGGGRVAVILTSGTSFDNIVMRAAGGARVAIDRDGAAGTVYLERATDGSGQGELIVDNPIDRVVPGPDTSTAIPDGQFWELSRVTVRNRGILECGTGTGLKLKADAITGTTNSAGIRLFGGDLDYPPATLTVSNWSLFVDGTYAITTDVTVLSNGRLTHSSNIDSEVNRMDLRISGNLAVLPDGSVDAYGCGYAAGQGPGSPGTDSRSGASHGGMGGQGSYATDPKIIMGTYGSFLCPTNLGSGGGIWGGGKAAAGGGALRLTVTGHTSLDGVIAADAATTTESGGSGGSVWFTTGSLSGSGTIRALGVVHAGGSTYGGSGGGGSVAVHLTSGATLGDVTLAASGGASATASRRGAAGTIYRRFSQENHGVLIIDGGGAAPTVALTELPHRTDPPPNELVRAIVTITNQAVAALTADCRVGDILVYADSTLTLSTWSLAVRNSEHHLDDISSPGPGGTTNRVDFYDQIIWINRGTVIHSR